MLTEGSCEGIGYLTFQEAWSFQRLPRRPGGTLTPILDMLAQLSVSVLSTL